MDIQGGRNFKKTCQQSQYHDIFENDNGRTITGLATLFIPATEGLEGFIGPFGESIVDDPTESQLAFLKKNSPHKHRFVGSRQFLAEERAKYEEFGDSEGLMDFRRKFPIEYADCWISGSSDTGLPHDIILARMDELSMMMGRKDKKIVRRGNFKRVNSTRFGHVTFLDDENGRFELSDWFAEDKDSNRFKMVDGEPVPLNISYGIAGGDPFKFTKNKDKRHSDGGGSVFMYRKPTDLDDNVRNWTGHRIVCAYRHKPPTKEEYCEDMAMMIQYYGVLMCSENNVPLLNDWLIEHGYRHYLKYLVNRKTGKFEVNPGVYTSDVVHQQIWSMTKDYLKMHGHRECHMGYLQECVDIEGVEQMGKYDLFAAVGMAMIGAEDMVYERVLEEEGEYVDLGDWF